MKILMFCAALAVLAPQVALAEQATPTAPKPQAARQEATAQQSATLAPISMPTAIERRLRGQDVSAAFGFLCGRDRGHYEDASAFGADPHGRFVGARLSFAF